MTEKKETPEPEKAEDQTPEVVSDAVKLELDKKEKTVIETTGSETENMPELSTDLQGWKPKTSIGNQVKTGLIRNVDTILDKGGAILETEIIDALLPGMTNELLMIGQAKGKFGGGQRRIFKQTQRKTMEGNKPSFSTFAVIGDKNGHVGVGFGKSKETVPAREKAIRNAKLSVFKIARGCGSWDCGCREPHSIPYEVHGKCGSVEIILKPAPRGKGLIIEKECMKILNLAGIKDVWARTKGQTKIKSNLIKACTQALRNLTTTKSSPSVKDVTGYKEGSFNE